MQIKGELKQRARDKTYRLTQPQNGTNAIPNQTDGRYTGSGCIAPSYIERGDELLRLRKDINYPRSYF